MFLFMLAAVFCTLSILIKHEVILKEYYKDKEDEKNTIVYYLLLISVSVWIILFFVLIFKNLGCGIRKTTGKIGHKLSNMKHNIRK